MDIFEQKKYFLEIINKLRNQKKDQPKAKEISSSCKSSATPVQKPEIIKIIDEDEEDEAETILKITPKPHPEKTESITLSIKDANINKLSSEIISRSVSRITSSEVILEHKGQGYIKDLTIVSESKINLVIQIDGKPLIDFATTFDKLNSITSYTDTITARQVGTDFIINIKELFFTQYIKIEANLTPPNTIQTIFYLYNCCCSDKI